MMGHHGPQELFSYRYIYIYYENTEKPQGEILKLEKDGEAGSMVVACEAGTWEWTSMDPKKNLQNGPSHGTSSLEKHSI